MDSFYNVFADEIYRVAQVHVGKRPADVKTFFYDLPCVSTCVDKLDCHLIYLGTSFFWPVLNVLLLGNAR